MSEAMSNIASALVKAQREFAPALKSSTNPHFKSKYADLAACIEAVIDALNTHGIALVQRQHPNESGVSIETVFIHESGETFSAGVLTVPAAKQDPQGYGSALTYARRYSLMAACGIAPEDDDGNAAKKTSDRPAAGMAPKFVADWQTYISDAMDGDDIKLRLSEAHAAAQEVKDRDAYAAFTASAKKRAAQLGVTA